MGKIERVHWYVTTRCDLSTCAYCFKTFPIKHPDGSLGTLEDEARILAESDIKQVPITGGEPTLVKNLVGLLRIIKDSGKHVSLHTNGLNLNERFIAELSGVVDDIALPIDSMNRETQKRLRGEGFLPTFDKLSDLAKLINKARISLGWHTVFTVANGKDMGEVYDFIKKLGFGYWRIYFFNDYLAFNTLVMSKLCSNEIERQEYGRRWDEIKELRGVEGPQDSYTDHLGPLFEAARRKVGVRDPKVQFVGLVDEKEPYVFLDDAGFVRAYHHMGYCFSRTDIFKEKGGGGKIRSHGCRGILDNIFKVDLGDILRKIERTYDL